jgi:hypothetical protein
MRNITETVRPTSMTVFAILNVVFGGYNFLSALIGLVTSPALVGGHFGSLAGMSGQAAVSLLISTILRIAVSVLLIVSGIGLMKSATWSRGCTLAYVIAAIPVSFLVQLLLLGIFKLPDAFRRFLGVLFGGFSGCIYPIVLFCFLKSSKWKEAFAARENEAA